MRRWVMVALGAAAIAGATVGIVSNRARGTGLVPAEQLVTVYRSASCSCCHKYEAYLEAQGFTVEAVVVEDTAAVKREHGIPEDLWSCHTATVDGYTVEGHVPAQAIEQLLQQRPAIDGIALPGMPSGSPGMGGQKEAPFEVRSFVGGDSAPYLVL